MASPTQIAECRLLLGGGDRWTDGVISSAIDAEGSVPDAAVLLLDSAATAASFTPDVSAGSQSIRSAHMSDALRRSAQRIRDTYGLRGATGTISTITTTDDCCNGVDCWCC